MAGPHAARPRPEHVPAGGRAHARAQTEFEVADLALADEGVARVEWAGEQMPVLGQLRARFMRERPLEGTWRSRPACT